MAVAALVNGCEVGEFAVHSHEETPMRGSLSLSPSGSSVPEHHRLATAGIAVAVASEPAVYSEFSRVIEATFQHDPPLVLDVSLPVELAVRAKNPVPMGMGSWLILPGGTVRFS